MVEPLDMKNPMKDARARLGYTREKMAVALDCSLWTVQRHELNPALTRGPWLLALRHLLQGTWGFDRRQT